MPRHSPKTKVEVPLEAVPVKALTSLEELMDNWITKRGDYFVTAFLDSTVMWEEKIDIESVPFIQYLITSLKLDKFYKTKELVRIKAFAFARNTLHSIDVNTLEYRLRISDEDASYTDGRQIVISGKVLELKKSKYEDLTGYDVFIGLALHEGCHILYTDFQEYDEYLKSKDLPKGATQLLHTIVNIMEDERIERKLLDKYPGHGNFLARLKEYYFGGVREKIELAEEENVVEFTNLFLQVIRYPKYIDELVLERYIDLLFNIKEILLPYPEEMGECLDKSYEVFELILEYFDLRFEREEDDDKLGEASEELTKSAGAGIARIDTSATDEEDGTEKGGTKSLEESILDGEYSFSEEGLKLFAENSTKEQYNLILDKLRKYLPGFRHFLFYNTYVKYRNLIGLKSGNLDTNKLVEGFQGIQSIYTRKEKPVLKRLTVSLLVDMSGSMGGTCMQRARECAVLLTEVFSTNKMVDLYVYGYTGQDITSHKAELYEFYTPKNPRKYSIVNMVAKAQNLDGFSLLQMRNEIRKDTNNDVLTFMISDGEPYASGYSGRAAIDHLKECVGTLEKDKFKIIHVAVGYSGLPDVYKNLVLVEDVATLANDLYILIKRTIK